MGSIGPEKILFVLVVALIVLGPERLPKVARDIGQFVSRLRELQARMESEVRDVVGEVPEPFLNPRGWLTQQAGSILSVPGDPAEPPTSPAGLGAGTPGGTESAEVDQHGGREPVWIDDAAVQGPSGTVEQSVERTVGSPETSNGWHDRSAGRGWMAGGAPSAPGLSAGEIGIVPGDPVLN